MFPWVLELLNRLGKKFADADSVLERVIKMEKEWKSKPRWSRKDEKLHGDAVDELNSSLQKKLIRLRALRKEIEDREQWITHRKEWVSIALLHPLT